MANRIQLRRDGAQQWANINPILAQGELGIEIDTSRIKIGDGVTPWNSLRYERPLETESNAANTLVKRDADGNFQAGAVTATLIGNASTSTRLANARQIQLSGQVTGSGSFDGSQNLELTTDLSLITTLPHYDPNNPNADALYTRVRVNSQGRVIGAELASTLANYGITDAQPLDDELSAIAGLTTLGLLTRTSVGNVQTRQLTGGAGRIIFTVPDGSTQNPFIDLADTQVVVGSYNVPSLTSIAGPGSNGEPYSTATVNATRIDVDRYGRITTLENLPIATATEGSKYASYDAATVYPRYSILEANSKVYQSIQEVAAGGGEPSHTSGTVGGWRFCNNTSVEQKGLASFAQEDFDVDANGHVTISAMGVDNTQLQNNQIKFTDRNSVQTFELDNEHTAATAHNGLDYLNHIHINDSSGGLLFSANNTDNTNAGGVDINVDTNISGASIKLDRPGSSPLQTIERTAGSLKIHHNVNSATDRTLDIISENAGSGTASINITADEDITISATNVANRVNIEGFQFQDDTLSSTAATMILDPGDDDTASGTLQVRGNLQVDGTTTTVNSTIVTIDDPIFVLGGDTAPGSDDSKDRGIEFSYYDTQARVGFFGWDEDYANANIWSGTGGFRFLYNATNTSEVFTGTDAALIAGNLSLTTNTGSTSTTTGTLVVTGGVGISQNVNVGGTVTVAGQSEINNNVIIKADNKSFNIQNNAGVDKFTVDTDNGNTVIEGTADIQLETTVTDNLFVQADAKEFAVKNASGNTQFVVDSDNGNTITEGTLNVKQGVDFDTTLNVDGKTDLNADVEIDGVTTSHNDIIIDTTGKTLKLNNGSADRFVVQSTSGNTDIEGTLNVASLIHFESSDTPTITTDGSNNYVIGSTDYGALRVDGGGYVAGDVLFASDLYVNGTINERDLGATETFNTQNYLRVRYKFRTGVTSAKTPSFAQDNDSNFRSFGGAGIATDLHIGDNLYVGKKATTDNIEFRVNNVGNTEIGRNGAGTNAAGTLTVHGDATFNREVNITGSQTTIGDATGDALTVEATSQFNSPVTLAAGQDLNVGGNATVEGDLTVNGTTTTFNTTVTQLDDPVMTLGGDTAPTTDDNKDRGIEFRYYDGSAKLGFFGWDDSASRFAVYDNASNSSEVFSGTRSGIDAGSIKLFDTTNATTASSGALIVGGGAGIGLSLFVGENLDVTGNTTIDGNVSIDGLTVIDADFAVRNSGTPKFKVFASSGNTNVEGTLAVSGISTLSSSVNITGAGSNLTVSGTGTILGDFDINSTKFTVAAASGNTVVDGTLDVNGATNVTNTFGVTGNITNTSTTQAGVTGTFANDGALRLSGGASITKNAAVGGILRVYGNSQLDGTLDVEGVTNFVEVVRANSTEDSVSASDNTASLYTAGGLAVTKKTWIGDDLDVGGGTFTVDGPTGNTAISGTLDVTQASNFAGITASGVAALQSTLNLTGSLNINSTKFNVAAATGNVTTAGTLGVTNAVDFDSTLNVDGNADFNAGIDVTAGNATFAGLVQADNVTDSTGYTDASASISTDGGLSVAKKAYVGGDLSVGGAAGIKASITAASGNTDIKGTLNVDDAVTFGGTLGVTGQITGDVTGDLTGNADTATQVAVTNTNNNTLFYPAFMGANTGNAGVFTDSANLTYNPFSNTLSVSNFLSTTNFEVQGNLNITGNITYGQSQVGDISNHNTDALSEGSTNLYYTDERVDDRVNNLFVAGAGLTKTYDDAANSYTLALDFSEYDTDDVTEGSSNLFTTAARTRTHFTYGTGIELSGGGQLSVTQADIDTDNVTEGSTNLFTTAARTRSHFTYGTGITHTSGTLSVTQSDIDTDNVTEGSTNLFTTAARTRGHISVSGSLGYNSSTGVISYTTPTTIASLSNHDTDDLAEGSNLYYTDARADARIAAADTDDLSEGSSNLYHTTARARAAISATGSISYNNSTGVISYTAPTLATVATSGDYDDLTNKPTLGTAAAAATGDFATAAQGTLATNALPASSVSTFGGTLIDDASASAARTTLGLGSAATTASTAYATAAQGTKADTNDTDLDSIYTELNAIGNNAAITTVAQLKAALAALSR